MKRSLNFFTGLALTTSMLLATTACEKPDQVQPLDPASGARVGDFGFSNGGFDPALFASKIEARLKSKVPGFGYRIWVNGQEYTNGAGGGGKARFALDAPERNYTATSRQGIASCTKFSTALLTMKLLERSGSLNQALERKVHLSCPKYLKASDDFKKVTFRDLLAQTSGIINYGNYSTNLHLYEATITKGIYDAGEPQPEPERKPFGQYDYYNMNYLLLGLCAVYLAAEQQPSLKAALASAEATIVKAKQAADEYNENETDTDGEYGPVQKPAPPTYFGPTVGEAKLVLDRLIGDQFKLLLRNEVFKPAGLAKWNEIDMKPWGDPVSQQTLYYKSATPAQSGTPGKDHTYEAAGTGGLVMSADELAHLVAATRAGKVVSGTILNKMKVGDGKFNQMGFDDAVGGKYGSYFHKNGEGSGNAILMDFDGTFNGISSANVQLAILTNMKDTDVTDPAVWAKLFDESWK